MTKECNKCKEIKDVDNFYKRYDRTNGYKSVCKTCDNKLSAERKKKNGYKYDKKRQVIGSKHHKLAKVNSRKHRSKMSDMYIRSLMTKKSKHLKSEDIPDELVQAYKENLRLKRQLGLTPELKETK